MTRDVLEAIERTGRGALTEMRRLVGMLRSDGGEPLAPQPKLSELPTLASQVRAAGLPVEWTSRASSESFRLASNWPPTASSKKP